VPWFLDHTAIGQAIVLSQARSMTRSRTWDHYPAPFALLGVLHHTLGQPIERGLEIEAQRVSDMVVGPECKNLVRLFRSPSRRRRTRWSPRAPAPQVRTLMLAGAGVMGGGIAELAGYPESTCACAT
jgi:3-hydroxyacyl-CoA dehydrogenase/enoyl-CoA hydratase/3-hydroxybutyryl-CoA epimerase